MEQPIDQIRQITGLRPGRRKILATAWACASDGKKIEIENTKATIVKEFSMWRPKTSNEVFYLSIFYIAIERVLNPAEINAALPTKKANKSKTLQQFHGEILSMRELGWGWRTIMAQLRRQHTRANIPTSVSHFIQCCKSMGII